MVSYSCRSFISSGWFFADSIRQIHTVTDIGGVNFMISIARELNDTDKSSRNIAFQLLIRRILAGSLVILFIGVCSFAVLFAAMCLL